eukprot:CAMPEP_0182547010 /NCGR_PEP_ID=MMETSP1323-20130603/36863_1 /TAXON_ID=236787 /ORGANISM="Florenciella parvula, Strain RCC1693" /LENGTH=54 /DNA_ID=CAMNT_0024758279 /DNA_START=239 /DNA_END=400 /DNA_ORIENTATION=-
MTVMSCCSSRLAHARVKKTTKTPARKTSPTSPEKGECAVACPTANTEARTASPR